MKRKKERRRPIICPYCGRTMVCMDRFESVAKRIKGLYVWYICPRRKGEQGCGHSVLWEISPKSKRPARVVTSVRFKRGK